MTPIAVLLVENHQLVRHGIRAVLEHLPGIKVAGEAENGTQGLQLIKKLRPDVVLMDISLQGMSGIEATASAVHEYPQVRVLILSMHTSKEYVREALLAGASGYLVKTAPPPELELAINAVAQGEMYISPAVAKPILHDYVQQLHGETGAPRELLTPRQSQVLQLIAAGSTTKEIARKLQLSVKTVEMHRLQLMKRLDVHDIAGVVRYAIRSGVISD